MQQSTHSHLHMAGQHNHGKHAPYYRPQEHHVICTKPSLVISTHDFIRPDLTIPPPSSFCRLVSSSTLFVTPSCLCDFSLSIYTHQPTFFFYFNSLHLLCSTSPQADIHSIRKPRPVAIVVIHDIISHYQCKAVSEKRGSNMKTRTIVMHCTGRFLHAFSLIFTPVSRYSPFHLRSVLQHHLLEV